VVDGITFASKKEAAHYSMLKLLEKTGQISDLKLQPRFPCIIKGIKVCTYVADFEYDEHHHGGQHVMTRHHIEDVKGVRTPIYRLKKKLVEALYNVVIEEV
jgi:hypothetical protein